MEDESLKQFSVDLRNLEVKVGMKTPESLLRWMHADTQVHDLLESESLPGDLFTKIKALKLEMRKLRSADVKILQQLEALNEGMESMRWLWEDHSSQISLTTNQSSQTFISDSQSISDVERCQICLPPAGQVNGNESAADHFTLSRSSDHSTMSSELYAVPVLDKGTICGSQGILLGHVESLDVQCSGAPRPKDKENESDPDLLNSELLLGYDVRWRWVEREDDVMFL